MRLAHQNHPGLWMMTDQTPEGPQRFGDALIRFQKPEDADERSGFVQSQAIAKTRTARVRYPGAMRNASHGARKSSVKQFGFHAAAMHDGRLGMREQPPQHGKALVIGAD